LRLREDASDRAKPQAAAKMAVPCEHSHRLPPKRTDLAAACIFAKPQAAAANTLPDKHLS